MEKSKIDEFVKKISFNKKLEDIQLKELNHWVEMIGIQKYDEYFKIVMKEIGTVSFEDIKSCAIYDFDLSELLFSLLKHFENYLRATILNNFDDFDMTMKNHIDLLQRVLSSNENKKLKMSSNRIKNYRLKKNFKLSEFIFQSSLGVIIKCYLVLDNKYIIFDDRNLTENISSIGRLRNEIYHHNVLICENFENKCYISGIKKYDIKSNIINLFKYLPSTKTKVKYFDYLIALEKAEIKDYNYVVRLTEEEKKVILDAKGCNNDY